MLRRVVSIVISLSIIVSLCGCSDLANKALDVIFYAVEEEQEKLNQETNGSKVKNQYSEGVLTSNSFESKFINVKFNCPNDFVLLTKEEINEMFNDSSKKFHMEMEATKINGGIVVMLLSEELKFKNITIEKYIDVCKNEFVKDGEFKYSSDEIKGERTIAGEVYSGSIFDVSSKDFNFKSEMLCRKKDDFIISFIIMYSDKMKSDAEKLLNTFTTCNLENENDK